MGSGYLQLSGGSGDLVTVAHSAGLNTVASVDLRIRLSDVSVTGTNRRLMRRDDGGANRVFDWYLDSDASLALRFFNSAAAQDGIHSQSMVSIAGLTVDLRAVINFISGDLEWFDRRSPSVALPSDTGWNALGTDALTNTDLAEKTEEVAVGGSISGADLLDARLYRSMLIHGVDGTGTVAMDANFSTMTQAEIDAKAFVEDSANAATVTINGTGWSAVADTPATSMMLLGMG